MAYPEDARHPAPVAHPEEARKPEDAKQPVSTVLDLPAGIEYLHLPGACLGALFEGNEDLTRSVRSGRQDLTYGLQLAVYEICANIVMHGYQICPPDDAPATDSAPSHGATSHGAPGDAALCRIHVVFTVAQQPLRLVIDLYDTGESFDIAKVPEPDIAEPQARGYGLYLIRQLIDEVVYEVQTDAVPAPRNHWRLTKFL